MPLPRKDHPGGRGLDDIALQTLHDEMRDDSRVIMDAFAKATERFARGDEMALEACAHQLCRLYNVFEQMSLRVAKAFENNIDDEKGWHTALLGRLAIAIAGIRPALIPAELKGALQELRAFRHVFVHAYELTLDPEKLALLLKYARLVSDRCVALTESFIAEVRREQSL